MQSISLNDKTIEHIFLDEFNGNIEKFFEFIKKSYQESKQKAFYHDESLLQTEQESQMYATWDNEFDKVWDEL